MSGNEGALTILPGLYNPRGPSAEWHIVLTIKSGQFEAEVRVVRPFDVPYETWLKILEGGNVDVPGGPTIFTEEGKLVITSISLGTFRLPKAEGCLALITAVLRAKSEGCKFAE